MPDPTMTMGAHDGSDHEDFAGWWAEREERAGMRGEYRSENATNGACGDTDAPRFSFIDDATLETRKAPPYLADGVMITDTVNHVVGPPGTLKSFLMHDLAAHITLDLAWHGRAVLAGPVLYVLAEGARSFGLRIKAWKAHHGHAGPIGIYFLTLPVQLGSPSDIDDLLSAVARLHLLTQPRLSIFDTQARCSVGLNENDAMDMGRMLAGAERVQREVGGAVALVHHTPRGEERERGSIAQRGGVDATLLVSADGDLVTLKVDRQKDGEDGQVLNFRKRVIELGPDDTGRMRSSCVLVPVSDAEVQRTPIGVGELTQSVRALLEALRRTPDGSLSSAALLKVTGMPERTFYDALGRAKRWNFVDGTQRSYRITPTGRGLFV